jgi:hypothetical protein
MAFSNAFERELNRLFHKRTHWLRQKLGAKGAGKPPEFRRGTVDAGISKLQVIASDALAHQLAKEEFDTYVTSRSNYHVKGWGPQDKKKEFEKWFATRFHKSKGLIYAFWGNDRKCIYIGRTGSGGSRPSSHFQKYWFSPVKRITIFSIKQRSHIPKLECLAIHRFRPTHNINKAATKKWTKACPLCTTHKYIERELRDIFRFR